MRDELERQYVEYFQPRLPQPHRLAVMLCGDADRADDIVQAAVTTLYTRWRHVRQVDNLDAYVRRSVVNTFLTERRGHWSRVLLTEALPDRAARLGAAGRRADGDPGRAAGGRRPSRRRWASAR